MYPRLDATSDGAESHAGIITVILILAIQDGLVFPLGCRVAAGSLKGGHQTLPTRQNEHSWSHCAFALS